jgi:2'-5' RNA ligase
LTTKTSARKIEPLYFIAIIPPQPVYDEVWKFKNYCKDQYHSKASLNSPPHITLHMPFRWKEEKEDILRKKLSTFGLSCAAGGIQLLNFGAFPPRVIYIDVVKNYWLENIQQELRQFCKRELNLFNANYKEHPFHPHLTIAFRDLKKPQFFKAWEEFKGKEFQASFSVSEITLLKHDQKEWRVLESFLMKRI